jgi:hypothetical protein
MKHSLTLISFALLLSFMSLSAQTTIPLPAQLSTAQTVFVANAGGPDNHLSQFAYMSFYHSMLNWKRFRLASRPADADLSFELTTARRAGATLNARLTVLELNIRDVKTQNLLWSFSEPVTSKAEISTSEMDATTSKLIADCDALLASTLLYEPAPKRFSEEGKK